MKIPAELLRYIMEAEYCVMLLQMYNCQCKDLRCRVQDPFHVVFHSPVKIFRLIDTEIKCTVLPSCSYGNIEDNFEANVVIVFCFSKCTAIDFTLSHFSLLGGTMDSWTMDSSRQLFS